MGTILVIVKFALIVVVIYISYLIGQWVGLNKNLKKWKEFNEDYEKLVKSFEDLPSLIDEINKPTIGKERP